MFTRIINYIRGIRAEEREQLVEKNRAKFMEKAREQERKTLQAAKDRLSRQPIIKHKPRVRVPYKEFKTVLEMEYVATKARYAGKKWTQDQQKEFNKKFAANLAKCQENPRFQKEYELYLELKNGTVYPRSNPQTFKEESVNRLHEEILYIHFALSPEFSNEKRYKDIRFKYEKKLDDNKKESEQEKAAKMKERHIITI